MLHKATQVQVTEDMIEQEHVVTGFCGQHITVSLTKNLHFSLMKVGSIRVGVSVLKTVDTGAVLIRDKLLKCPFMIRRLVCGVPLLLCV
jgi:hypothetical protein